MTSDGGGRREGGRREDGRGKRAKVGCVSLQSSIHCLLQILPLAFPALLLKILL